MGLRLDRIRPALFLLGAVMITIAASRPAMANGMVYYGIKEAEAYEMIHLIRQSSDFATYQVGGPDLDRLYNKVRDKVPALTKAGLARMIVAADESQILCYPGPVDFNDLKRWIKNGDLQRVLARAGYSSNPTQPSVSASASDTKVWPSQTAVDAGRAISGTARGL